MRYFLGIETSCDETGVGIFDASTQKIVANELFSQIKLHQAFGGVMPEVASRSHVEKIRPIFESALKKANIELSQVDVIGVTNRPGLFGSLLVGLCFAKSVGMAAGIPVIGVDHNYGHILSSLLDQERKLRTGIKFPLLCLSASGGHTSIFMVNSFDDYVLLGNTTDDAAGEAFDKVAKLLGLSYPGGPIVERQAALADNRDYFCYPRSKDRASLNFSFSGLKTAVLYSLVRMGVYSDSLQLLPDQLSPEIVARVCSSFQVCVADIFAQKLEVAFSMYPQVSGLALVGGVSCNKFLVDQMQKVASKYQKDFFSPPREFCTDNGAMISLGTYFAWQRGERIDLDQLDIGRGG